jgi:hypothetical protein
MKGFLPQKSKSGQKTSSLSINDPEVHTKTTGDADNEKIAPLIFLTLLRLHSLKVYPLIT